MIGTKLANRYEIVDELGRGGMGVVYRAHDPLLNRDVAVKLVPPSNLTPSSEERFRREAQLVAQMDHPSIVPIFDIGEHEGSLFFLMPVVSGKNLRSFLKHGAHTLGEILDIVIQVAEALDYSHIRGVIHRDIKPENVMVSEEDGALRVRVMDFGLAKGNVGTSLTKTGTLVGTVSYFSPEQVSKATIDSRSDLYSLGVVLYEAMTGKPPFVGEIQTVLYRIAHEFPRSPRAAGAKIDEEFDEIVMKMLAKDPSRRFQRGSEAAEALRSYREKLQDEEMGDSLLLSTTLTAQIDRGESSPFVGREKELAEIQRRLNSAVDGECQFVVVAGEPGIGKTRLLEEVEKLAHARRIRVLHGRFVEQDRTFSYQGFCEVIQEYFRSRETSTSSSGEHADFSDLAADLGALFPVLMEISEIRSASGSGEAARGAGKKIEDRTFVYELLARTLVRIAGGKPLVLVFENLHGAEMSIEALQYVVRRLGPTPTLIAATYRQTETDKAHPLVKMLDGFTGDPRFSHVVLGPLTSDEHRELLSTLVGTSRLSGAVIDKLYEATEANPFFTKELVRSLIDSGGIAPDETGEWTMAGEMGISADALPVTIQQAVEKRIERLPEELRNVLATASILGKTFDFGDLELLAGDEVELDDAIDTLIADGILEEERESRGDRLTFASGIVRDVLYNDLSRRKRKSLHRKYGTQIEKKHAGRLDRVLPQLVHHFSEGDEPEKTVTYGLQLAKKTLAAFSPEETIHVARTVLEFLEDDEWGPDPGLEGEVRLILASAIRQQGNLDAALREAESAVRIFEKVKDPGGVVKALLAASEICWQSRKAEETRKWLVRGIEVARGVGDRETLPQLLSIAATMASFRGEHDAAREYLDEIEQVVGKAKVKTQEAPTPGGVLTAALANPVVAKEPAEVGIDEEVEVLALVFETLVVTDERGHVAPCLCEEWEVREQGHSLLLRLRNDVRFHDGKLLTAEDVKKSFERSILLRKREMSAAFAAIRGVTELKAGTASDVSGIVVRSEHELEILIDDPLPIYPALLTDATTGVVRVVDDANVVGTGPFRIASHRGSAITLERNEEYWGVGRPPLDGIEFRIQKGSSEIATGLRSGALDLVRDLLPQDLDEILRQPAFRAGLAETPKKNSYFIVFNSVTGAATNDALRRALAGVVRTNDLVWRALGRLAQPATGLIPPGVLGHDAGRRRTQLSTEEAVALLDQAGLARPIRLRAALHPLFGDRYRSLTSAIFDAWSKLGVEVEVATPDMDTFLQAFQSSAAMDMIIARWNADYDDPDNFTHGLFRSRTGVYSAWYGLKETDELLDAARSETDPSEREGLYRRFENMVLESAAIIPLFHEIDYRVGSPKVKGLELRSTPPYVNYTELGKSETLASSQASRGGGIIHVPVTEDIPDLDPVMVDTYDRQEVVSSIFQCLTAVTQGARMVPQLASDFRLEDGGRRFRFFLRNDLQFHNGRRLTARDVRYSWERLLLRKDSVNRSFLAPVRGAQDVIDGRTKALAGFRIVSAREFVVELESPQAFFPTIVSHPSTAILPEGTETVQGTWRDSFAGTGPFRVVRFDPGRRLELERNPDYWRPGYPNSDGLVFHLGMAPERTLAEFKAGRLSIASDLHLRDIDALRHDPMFGSGYCEAPRLSIYFAAFNTRSGPTTSRDLRASLMEAVDVEGIVRRTLGRLAIPAKSIVPPGLLGYADDIGRSRIAAKGGEPLDLELEAVVHPIYFTHFAATLAELREALKKVGVRIRVLNKTMSEYLALEAAGAGQLLIGRWIADYPDADTFIHGMLYSKGAQLSLYCSFPAVDDLAERARVEADPAIRHTLYVQAQEIVAREALLLPLFHDQSCRFARPELEGLRVSVAVPEVPYEELAIR
jgi:ABC-type transport system substrate-binding protein/serine/threonine protein kinase